VYINIEGPRRAKWIAEVQEQLASIVVKLCDNLISVRVAKIKFRREVLAIPLTDVADLCRQLKLAFTTMKNE
jgi:hypothetical protein